jgi:hypothetical protein
MPINFNEFTTASAYTGVPTSYRDAIAALSMWMDPTLTGTVTGAPTGAKRLNETTGLIERFSGTSWSEYTGIAYAKKASPAFTGTPTAPTQAADNNSTRIATTAFVVGQAGTAAPLVNGTAAAGTSLRFARQDHVHPTDTTRAPLASPAFTGNPTAPTQAAGSNNTRLATTAFVQGELALYAPLESPSFTGIAAADGGLRATGFNTPASGSGLELFYLSSIGYVTAYNRTAGAYLELRLRGLSTKLYANGSSILEASASNVKMNKKAYTAKASVAYAASLTIDTDASNIIVVGTLTGNVTSMTLNNATEGQFISLRFKQDATGGRTVALPAGAKVDGSIATGANRTSYLNLTWNATDARWEGNWFQVPA